MAFDFGLWSVTDRGIAFVTIEPESDAIDFYAFADRKVRRLGRLPFRVSRYARPGHAPRRPGRPLGTGERDRPVGERHQGGRRLPIVDHNGRLPFVDGRIRLPAATPCNALLSTALP